MGGSAACATAASRAPSRRPAGEQAVAGLAALLTCMPATRCNGSLSWAPATIASIRCTFRPVCTVTRCPCSLLCRDYLKGHCPFPGTCSFTHLQLDLPAEGPPPGSKPLVCAPRAQQQQQQQQEPPPQPQPKPAAPKVRPLAGVAGCICKGRLRAACATAGFASVAILSQCCWCRPGGMP